MSKPRIFYICNAKKCPKVECLASEVFDEMPTYLYSDNSPVTSVSDCCHTTDVKYAAFGPIKGPIDLFKRFKIHIRPYLYLEEKLCLK